MSSQSYFVRYLSGQVPKHSHIGYLPTPPITYNLPPSSSKQQQQIKIYSPSAAARVSPKGLFVVSLAYNPFGSRPSVLAPPPCTTTAGTALLQGEFPCVSRFLPTKKVIIPVVVFSMNPLLHYSNIPMLSSFSSVGFCGSRSLPASAQPLVSSVVQSVLSGSRASLAVGCSVGADAFVLSSVPHTALPQLSVFAAFGFGGSGSCRLSAVQAVLAAARGGASVRWWAGGLPSVALRQRLALRSVALVRHLACSPARRSPKDVGEPPSALVCFLSSPRSRGSLLACRLAARCGVPVFVFCVGFSPSRLPRLRRGGLWSLVQVGGLPAVSWRAQ